MYTSLPTIEECRTFLEVVNRGREAAGLEPLAALDYDGAYPGCPWNCLSALNLFIPVGCTDVGGDFVVGLRAVVADAIDAEGSYQAYKIPSTIKRVTDPFDARTPGLREQLLEAGVIA